MEKHRIQPVAFRPQEVGDDLNTLFPENPDTLAGYQRIGIPGADDHPADTGGQKGIGAGRLLSVMAAGLQRDVDVGAGRIFCAGGQGVPFCVEAADFLVIACTDDAARFYNDGTHQRVRIHMTRPQPGQADRPVHVIFIGAPGIGAVCFDDFSDSVPILHGIASFC